MFGIINFNEDGLNENDKGHFEYMNSPGHQYTNLPCSPVQTNGFYICHSKNHPKVENLHRGYLLFFEGKIFNQPALIDILADEHDEQLLNSGPTAILLAAYLRWEEEFVNYLEGEFIIVICNTAKKTIKAFRDALGIMPFYYIEQKKKCFLFQFGIEKILMY